MLNEDLCHYIYLVNVVYVPNCVHGFKIYFDCSINQSTLNTFMCCIIVNTKQVLYKLKR